VSSRFSRVRRSYQLPLIFDHCRMILGTRAMDSWVRNEWELVGYEKFGLFAATTTLKCVLDSFQAEECRNSSIATEKLLSRSVNTLVDWNFRYDFGTLGSICVDEISV
jgi:hypothetical protein